MEGLERFMDGVKNSEGQEGREFIVTNIEPRL
jgi:hypothetical protein